MFQKIHEHHFTVHFTTQQPGVNTKLLFLRESVKILGYVSYGDWGVMCRCTCVYVCARACARLCVCVLGVDIDTSKPPQRGPGSLMEGEHPIILYTWVCCVIHVSLACLTWEECTLLGRGSNGSLGTKRSTQQLPKDWQVNRHI